MAKKQDCYSQILTALKLKLKIFNENFSKNKKMPDLRNYCAKSRHYDDSIPLVVGKIIDEIGGVKNLID